MRGVQFLWMVAVLMCGACGGEGPTGLDAGTDAAADADGGGPDDASVTDGRVPDDADMPGDAAVRVDGGTVESAIRTTLCGPLAAAVCGAFEGCSCRPSTPAGCLAEQTDACTRFHLGDGRQAALEAGRASLDADTVATCVARVETALEDCSLGNADYFAFCQAVILDDAAIGDPCAVGGAVCAGGAGACLPVPGGVLLCRALALEGAPCEPGTCARGLACASGRCAAPAAEGASCVSISGCRDGLRCVAGACRTSRVAEGGACTETAACAFGLSCEGGRCAAPRSTMCTEAGSGCPSLSVCRTTMESRCIPPLDAGGRCDTGAFCGPGLYCDFDAAPAVCRVFPGVGEPCPIGLCRGDAWCTPSGRCDPLGMRGELCVTDTGGDGCAEGLSCASGLCGDPPALGQPCGAFAECAAGLACQPDGMGRLVCATPGPIGDGCDLSIGTNGGCADTTYCDPATSVCQPRLPASGPCDFDTQCQDGLTCFRGPPDFTGTCQTLPGRDERCESACASGLVCGAVATGGSCVAEVCEALPSS